MNGLNVSKVKVLPLILLFLTVLVIGILYIRSTWLRFEKDKSEAVLQIAQSIGVSLPIEDVKKLEASSSDTLKTEYVKIKNILKEIIRVNPNARFAYIYVQKNKKLYFLADSEPENSKDYSPPGQEYYEADNADKQPFIDGKDLITSPLSDRWGTWVSVLTPIRDLKTGETIAVFAMDFNAKSWSNFVVFEIVESIIVVILFLLAFMLILLINAKNNSLKHDISERKKAELLLHESEKKYRLIAEKISDVVWLMDFNGENLFVSPSITSFSGYSVEEYLSQTINQRFTKSSAEFVIEIFKNEIYSFNKLEDFRLDYRKTIVVEYVCKDGSIKIGEILITPYLDDSNKCIGIHGVTRDITHRKRAEDLLKTSEEKYRILVENSNEAIYVVQNEKIVFANKMCESIIGTSVENLIGKSILSLVDIEEKENLSKHHNELMSGTEYVQSSVFLINNAQNEKRWLSVNSVRIIWNEMPATLNFASDISDRKRVEEALIHSEEKFRKAFLMTPDSININRLKDGLYVSVNKGFTSIMGFSETEVIGKTSVEINIWKNSKDREKLVRDLKTDGFVENMEAEFCMKDGTVKIGLMSAALIELDGVPHIISVTRDISDRKREEAELIKAKEKAEESDRLKSAFLANMSHEIRTPMNGILGFADLLKEPKLTGEEQREYISIIEKSGERMLSIINDIISISKVESGQMEVFISDININEQFEYINSFFKPEAEQKGLKLLVKKNLPDNQSVIKTDGEKVYAVLINLVKNALKFTQQGYIELDYVLKTDTKPLTLEFRVKDSGIGIRPDQINVVFERFRQGNESLSRSFEGAGLGLSISKAYVEMLGGKIWVESQLGKGSTFFFTLPYKTEENFDKHDSEISIIIGREEKIKNLKIIIAEDDATSALFASKLMTPFCRDILLAKSGYEAVEACRLNPDVDLVLMDAKMPVMNGYEATAQIRLFNKEVIIIAQTAFALSEDQNIAIEAGCNDYVSKPIKKEILFGILNKYFGKK